MPSPSQYDVGKVSLKPKRHHGYNVLLFILGTLFPPLAVAARFGIGTDFFLNLFLTIAGYIPGHVHNFYIQNIRNNKNNRRTPKWAQRYGLVDTSAIKRHEKRSQWASRYNERNPHSALEDQPLEDGQIIGGPSSTSLPNASAASPNGTPGSALWNPNEEQYYHRNDSGSVSSANSRWRYPANFDDTMPSGGIDAPAKRKSKSAKKDRHARTEDAYTAADDGTAARRRKKKKRSSRSAAAVDDYAADPYARPDSIAGPDGPEDPEGGAYGGRSHGASAINGNARTAANGDDIFQHEF